MNLDNQNPPLRIRENDGNPNVIPVFDIVLSDNLSLLKIRPGVVSISASTSAALAGPTYAPTGGNYVTFLADANLSNEKILTASDNIVVTTGASNIWISAVTNSATGGGASTAGNFITFIADAGLSNERILTASDNIVATTSSTIFWISAITGNISGKVDTSTTLTAIYPITGGGTLSTNRSFSIDTAFLVNTGRTLTAGSGLSGGGNLSADQSFSVNTNVRDKIIGWFAAGNLSTAMLIEEMRVKIPFNMEPIRCDLAVTTTNVGAGIICNLFLFDTPIAAGTGIFATVSRPAITTGGSVGSSLTFNPTVLHAGSFLGLKINQVGSTVAGSNLTVTLWTRAS